MKSNGNVEYNTGYMEGNKMINDCVNSPVVRDVRQYVMACVYAVKIQTKAGIYSESFLEGYEQAITEYFK